MAQFVFRRWYLRQNTCASSLMATPWVSVEIKSRERVRRKVMILLIVQGKWSKSGGDKRQNSDVDN